MEGDATWTLPTLILLPLLLILIVVSLVVTVAAAMSWRSARTRGSFTDAPVLLAGGVVALLVLGIGTAVGFYPYKAEYHQFVTKVGTVESIKSRLLGSSDSFQQKFVVRYTDGRLFGCEDTRCAVVKPGNTLTLACKRTWQYAGEDGYDCKYIRNEVRS